jgi:hypothetical protein
MGNVGIQLDQHTLDRLDALLLLLNEVEPDCRCDRNEALRLSVDMGLKVLLSELLARGRKDVRPRGFPAAPAKRLSV